jgi:predicted TIM-barrel enzyme
VRDYLAAADGFIVGSSLKAAGRLSNPVDAKRVAALVRALRA